MHIPVLLNEVLKYLEPKPNENFIDATFGFGGHSLAILKKTGPDGRLLGIDADCLALEKFKQIKKSEIAQLGQRLKLICANFTELEEIAKQQSFKSANGILFDLGFSSWQIEESGRGFSFLRDEPLDMRYQTQNRQGSLTAEKIVNTWPEQEVQKILRDYGEERFARRIAGAICQERQKKSIKATGQLAEVIEKSVPASYRHGRLHSATRTFQALRIATNDELNNLKKGLKQALAILAPQGRLVVISFHSLEDRIVKHFFRQQKQAGNLEILTKKPIRPIEKEIKKNPRSRSAKLRAAIIANSK